MCLFSGTFSSTFKNVSPYFKILRIHLLRTLKRFYILTYSKLAVNVASCYVYFILRIFSKKMITITPVRNLLNIFQTLYFCWNISIYCITMSKLPTFILTKTPKISFNKNNYCHQHKKYFELEVYLIFDPIRSVLHLYFYQVDQKHYLQQKINFLLDQEITHDDIHKQIQQYLEVNWEQEWEYLYLHCYLIQALQNHYNHKNIFLLCCSENKKKNHQVIL